jgi:hypothetical protein
VAPHLPLEYEFAVAYELEQLDRVDWRAGTKAYGYPGGDLIGPQARTADKPILRVLPQSGDAWVGIFYGQDYQTALAAPSKVIAWPDGRSFCVVYEGAADVVRADDPTKTYEIDTYLVTGVTVLPEHGMVVFADFQDLTAYGPDGLLWRSGRLAADDLRIEGVDGDSLLAYGFMGNSGERFSVDIATGRASDSRFRRRG